VEILLKLEKPVVSDKSNNKGRKPRVAYVFLFDLEDEGLLDSS